MKEKMRVVKKYLSENLELLFIPVFFLVFIMIFSFASSYFSFPTQNDLMLKVQNYMNTFGLVVIFISAVIESALLLGMYFPGSLVIFFGVASTQGNPILAVKTVLTVCMGMTLGYTLNYCLGRFGWYKVLVRFGFEKDILKMESRIKEKGILSTFVFYIMPGFGSLLSTALGVLKYNFIGFLTFTILMVTVWNIFWGILVYYFGMKVFNLLTNWITIFIIFCGYIYYLHTTGKLKAIMQDTPKNKDKEAPNSSHE